MSASRPPAVAGRFYPGDPTELRGLVRSFLNEAPGSPSRAPAAIVPHAGLIYSGACAAHVFRRVVLPATVVILAPNHTGRGRPDRAGIWADGVFETPLGGVAVDEEVAAVLLARDDLVVEDRAAHRAEHAIEVELPFLQELDPAARIVPIVLPWVGWDRCRELAALLADLGPDTVIVLASSDMTHYLPARRAAAQDELALERVRALDGKGLLAVCHRHQITMCGRGPAAVALEVARRWGATAAEVVDYRHSGVVTGDDTSVVSYAGVVIS